MSNTYKSTRFGILPQGGDRWIVWDRDEHRTALREDTEEEARLAADQLNQYYDSLSEKTS